MREEINLKSTHLSDTRLGLVLPSEALITRLSYRLQERRFGPCPREPTKQGKPLSRHLRRSKGKKMLCLTGNTEGAFHWSQASWRAVVQTMSLCWTVSPNPLFSHHFTTIYHGSQSRTIGNHLLHVLSLSKRVNTGSMAASRFTVIINKMIGKRHDIGQYTPQRGHYRQSEIRINFLCSWWSLDGHIDVKNTHKLSWWTDNCIELIKCFWNGKFCLDQIHFLHFP